MNQNCPSERQKRIMKTPYRRITFSTWISLLINLAYAIYHGALGVLTSSSWFTAMCVYYIILSILRISAVICLCKKSAASSIDAQYFAIRLSGGLLVLLSFALSAALFISLRQNIVFKHGSITMITIASYTFYKIAAAIAWAVKQKRPSSPLFLVIRRIRYAEVAASVITLQRSMVATFGSPMKGSSFFIMDSITGALVCLFIFSLGINLIIKRRKYYGKIKAYKSQ